jgi:hypothetical protein
MRPSRSSPRAPRTRPSRARRPPSPARWGPRWSGSKTSASPTGRILDVLDPIRGADVVVVAAGREGALPTVVAGLVDTPVIGLPVSTGYGFGGDGEAALSGMLQSCTVLSTVNVDAGFVAGAQAGLVARAVDGRSRPD